LLGVVGMLSRRPFDPQEFALEAIFADQAAMAIKSAYLFRELGRVRDRLEDENAYLQGELRDDHDFDFGHIVGGSQTLRSRMQKLENREGGLVVRARSPAEAASRTAAARTRLDRFRCGRRRVAIASRSRFSSARASG
jgi:GAF domain-containing protein